MHPASENLQIQLRHCQFIFIKFKRLVSLVLVVLLAFCFIVELVVDFELFGREVPGDDDEKDPEDGPPEADSEAPYHADQLVFE
jgi:hypothetical protein